MVPQGKILYREFKEDGWPLCPHCRLDELFCPDTYRFVISNKHNPNIEECIALGLQCYACHWSSEFGLRVLPWIQK